jgi:hypothetical protein
LLDSKVPADWQVSNVAVIHKRGSKSNVGNYRPISLTSIVCKQMESIIRDHIMDHFTENNLISKKTIWFHEGEVNSTSTIEGIGYVDSRIGGRRVH